MKIYYCAYNFAFFVLLLLLQWMNPAQCLYINECEEALGMESGSIKDSQINASSSFDYESVGPRFARIRTDKAGGAWCPKPQIDRNVYEYLELDFQNLHILTAVETQGRYGGGVGREYATLYVLDYFRTDAKRWMQYKTAKGDRILQGNVDTVTRVKHVLDPPIVATRIRFVPYSTHPRTMCMRVEVYGCRNHDGLISYDAPEGQMFGQLNLKDKFYDGVVVGQKMTNGLGQLTDGHVGDDHLSDSFVGWRNITVGDPLEIFFTFDSIRNFTAIKLNVINVQNMQIRFFSEAKVYFSLTNVAYNPNPLKFSYIPNTFSEKSKGNFSGNFVLEPITIEQLPNDVQNDFEDSTESLVVAPVKGVPSEYMFLIFGAMVICLAFCCAIVCVVVYRRKSNRKLASPAYSGIRLVDADQIATDLKNLHTPAVTCSTAGMLGQLNGNLYVLDAEHGNRHCPVPKVPLPATPLDIHFPPPPSSDYTESSEYAEPSALVTCSSTLPLLPSISDQTVDSGFSSKDANVTCSPSSPDLCKLPRSRSNVSAGCGGRKITKTLSDDDTSNLHYASSDIASTCHVYNRKHVRQPSSSYNNFERESHRLNAENLKFLKHFGDGYFGPLCLCRYSKSEYRLVLVKYLREESSQDLKREFCQEIEALARLDDPNVARLVGSCTTADLWSIAVEYPEQGDLHTYLKERGDSLSYGALIFIATSVASGMKHLESVNFVLRDLSTRNCWVGKNHSVKIGDCSVGPANWPEDYCRIPDAYYSLPVRWSAWECIILAQFSTKSDVWSFGVTLWEILFLAKRRPFDHLTDGQVIENAQNIYLNASHTVRLHQPANCPKEIYDLMLECWQRSIDQRPTFKEIHLFLQRKNLGFDPYTA